MDEKNNESSSKYQNATTDEVIMHERLQTIIAIEDEKWRNIAEKEKDLISSGKLKKMKEEHDSMAFDVANEACHSQELMDEYLKNNKEWLKEDPKSYEANVGLGIIQQKDGKFEEAIKIFQRVIKNAPEDIGYAKTVDTLNQLAVTYQKKGDYENALKYYNLSLQEIAQSIYDRIKDSTTPSINEHETRNNDWARLAFGIAKKNAAINGIEKVLLPTEETSQQFNTDAINKNVIMSDVENTRYLLDSYFSTFYVHLKNEVLFCKTLNKVGELFMEMNDIKNARAAIQESIDFIPEDFEYREPFINLEKLGDVTIEKL